MRPARFFRDVADVLRPSLKQLQQSLEDRESGGATPARLRRHESTKATETEIEVTPEMIEAGARIYIRESDDTEKEVVAKIYRAMECVRRASKK